MPQYTFNVEPQDQSLRLDIYLTKNLPDQPSRTFVKHLIETDCVLVNDKSLKPHHKVAGGDVIVVNFSDPQETAALEPENIPLDIFYEDEAIVLINKPVGMLVHPTAGMRCGTLVNALLYHCQKLSSVNHEFRPGIVHRLDRETSGLVVVAKDNQSHIRLSREFEKHRVRKKYVALVQGEVAHEEGIIDAALGKHSRHFDKKAVRFDETAKAATTRYKVLKVFRNKATLVALYPQTGRTHQLRVHMAYLGHSILGDDKYGQRGSFPRLALHAQSIGFHHPQRKVFMEFSSLIPKEFLAGF